MSKKKGRASRRGVKSGKQLLFREKQVTMRKGRKATHYAGKGGM